MGFFSSKTALVRFKTNGSLGATPAETLKKGLDKHIIRDITCEPDEIMTGWTSLKNPYTPSFDDSSYLVGTYFVFGLRIDKKRVPGKVLAAQYQIAEKKLLEESGREFLSKTEKKQLKENVKATLLSKTTPVPHVYEVVWDYEKSLVMFFATQQSAVDELETLFLKSFDIHLVRLFPFTIASFDPLIPDQQKELINTIQPISFREA